VTGNENLQKLKKMKESKKRGDDSLQSQLDYSRYNGNGPNAMDITPDSRCTPAPEFYSVTISTTQDKLNSLKQLKTFLVVKPLVQQLIALNSMENKATKWGQSKK